MTERYTETEVLSTVSALTRSQLIGFVEAEIIVPIHTESGPMYRRVDLVRVELLCELCDNFNLNDDALCIIISLIDQLHSTRNELHAILKAVEAEPKDVRQRLGKALLKL